jgi:hypothetical protein
MTTTNLTGYEVLLRTATGTLRVWSRNTIVYGTLYPLMRICLIVASAIVAVRETLAGSPLEPLSSWIPLLALGVSIVTALDTWMKPQVRWQGYVRSRDDLSDLVLQMKMMGAEASADALEKLRERLNEIHRQHRQDYVF